MSGLIGKKIGMTQYYTPDGHLYGVTVVEAGPCPITQVKTVDRDGYAAVQIGFGIAKKLNLAEKGHLGYGGLNKNRKQDNKRGTAKADAPLGLLRHLKEVPVSPDQEVKVGDVFTASNTFEDGALVDIIGVSKGKGFQGGVHRHHFAGGPKTHGQSDRHRAPGSVGSGTTPGRVFKGQKMAGHMGDVQVTAKNLQILKIDTERNLLLIKGSVPGPTNGLVLIRRAKSS